MFIDAHAHYDDEAFSKDGLEIMRKAYAGGCDVIINAAQDIATTKQILKMTEELPFLYGTAGIHPHCAKNTVLADIELVGRLAQSDRCVAIGEIGLDYHYDFCPREKQKTVFSEQLELAGALSLPVVVHDREAHEDTLKLLEYFLSDRSRCLIHCYSGSREMAEIIMKRGYYVSIGGAVTFKNARRIMEALEVIPLERILLETDCPYMTPVPLRGQRNDSRNIPLIAAKIAEVKGCLLDSIYKITSKNATEFYNLQKKMVNP